jgi:opacity protein-like surface antigen
MHIRTTLLLALASLAVLANPASAADMARPCVEQATIDEVQECVNHAEQSVQRTIDNAQATCGETVTVDEAQRCLTNAEAAGQAYIDRAQDVAEEGLGLVCDVVCNFVAL